MSELLSDTTDQLKRPSLRDVSTNATHEFFSSGDILESQAITFDKFKQRQEVFFEIVAKYNSGDRISKGVDEYRNNQVLPEYTEDSFGRYLAEISQYKLLTKDDEKLLFNKIEKGLYYYSLFKEEAIDEPSIEQTMVDFTIAYQTLYATNLRLVVFHATKLSRKRKLLSIMDAAQDGNFGLSNAICRFNIFKGYKFSTYASWWIKQAIVREHISKKSMIYIPAFIGQQSVNFRIEVNDLEESLGRKPTEEEIKQYTNQSPDKIEDFRNIGKLSVDSLNDFIGDEKTTEFIDVIPDNMHQDTEGHVLELFNQREVQELLASKDVNDKERLFLSLRFGVYVDCLKDKFFEIRSKVGRKTILETLDYGTLFNRIPQKAGATGYPKLATMLGMGRSGIEVYEKQLLMKLFILLNQEVEI
jgi:RNA polymerase primary sigma factor